MSRIPIRLRLALAFAVAMAVVLAVLGAFLYVRLERSLTAGLDDTLELRAGATAAALRRPGPIDLAPAGDDGVTQVLRLDGSLLASSPRGSGPLVSAADAARARRGSFHVRKESVALLEGEPGRLLVQPVRRGGGDVVLVVGASLQDREDALHSLLTQLFIAGPLALLVASLLGYFVAAGALRPVEAMRRRAEEVSTERPGTRLPVPEARDEVRALGETLNAMLGRLEAGLARERRFVADASHELRTPLSLLQAELELALRRPRSREELEQAVRSAAAEADRLARLAEDLLVLAQLDEGALQLQRERLVPRELLETVAGRFAARAEAEGRALAVEADAAAPITGDALRLEQALGNLVDNAFRHGGGAVRLSAATDGDAAALSVGDEGSGFPPVFLPHAFERFARADPARGGGAAGLGLAIVEAVARAHGGSATAANASPGAVVTLYLPSEELSVDSQSPLIPSAHG
jgi:two-component system OmpR family sensor kinase